MYLAIVEPGKPVFELLTREWPSWQHVEIIVAEF